MNIRTPSGFRDVLSEEAIVREHINRSVQDLFASHGYLPIETPTLEIMDVMEAGGHVAGSPFKFFDGRGDLLAMRPDVTTQVARMCATRLRPASDSLKFRYTQRVFREAETDTQATAREMTQVGIECIGESGPETDAEIIGLFAEALETAEVPRFTLALATVGVLRALLARSGAPEAWKRRVLEAYHSSNFVELECLCDKDTAFEGIDTEGPAPAYAQTIAELARIRGGREAIDRVRELAEPLGCIDGLDAFERTYNALSSTGLGEHLLVDFSVMSSFDYYTGIVFEAYAPRLGTPLGGGGRYDNMVAAYGSTRPAAGFAFYLEQAMASRSVSGTKEVCDANGTCGVNRRPLRIAVPKGALVEGTRELLALAGLDSSGLKNPGRQLIISTDDVEFIIVRPTDAPIFVALGAADCGICGKDSLLEAALDVVELTDLRFGDCRFVVAEPEGTSQAVDERYRTLGSIRIATKYPRITREYYGKMGTQVEIVKLHGNIELAPLTGMAERIVDITATGTTLRENNLVVVDEVLGSTARFFANPCALRTDNRIVALAQKLAGAVSSRIST